MKKFKMFFKELLQKCGLYTESKVDELINKSMELSDKYNDLFTNKKVKPTYPTFEQFSPEPKFNNAEFYKWWDKYAGPEHDAVKLRKISLNPNLLKAFMLAFGTFNWAEVYVFMVNTNWIYSNRNNTPTIAELQSIVIELLPLDGFKNKQGEPDKNNTISSGGFSVTAYTEDNENYIVNIEFSFNSNPE